MSALTKILIVLQLVFSLVVSVLLVLFISKTQDAKATLVDEHTKYVAISDQYAAEAQKSTAWAGQVTAANKQVVDAKDAQGRAEKSLADLAVKDEQEKTQLMGQLADANRNNMLLAATNKSLAETGKVSQDALAELRDQVPSLTTKNGQLIRANQELSNQLNAANNSIRNYQEMLAARPDNTGAEAVSPGMAPQVTPIDISAGSGKINGQVSDVAMAAGREHIEMRLGSRDGITVGTKMFVYRGNSYVGDVTVETVTPEQSAAVVVSTKPGETVQKGDFVSTVGN